MATIKHFIGIPCKALPPTKDHRAALWESMLGTVYAMDTKGEVRYFGYNYEAARAFAGVDGTGADTRLAKVTKRLTYVRSGATESNPQPGKLVVWVKC